MTFGGEHAIQCTDIELYCTFEIYIVVLKVNK